jgi:starvation-inducible outer membrane lipoprotein
MKMRLVTTRTTLVPAAAAGGRGSLILSGCISAPSALAGAGAAPLEILQARLTDEAATTSRPHLNESRFLITMKYARLHDR